MKKIRFKSLAAIALIFTAAYFLSCSSDNPASGDNTQKIQRGSLTGKVVDKKGAGLEGVAITSEPLGYSTVTGATGNFTLPDIEAGTYRFHFLKVDYLDSLTGELSFGLAENKTMGNVRLLYAYAKVTGTITDGLNPLINAGVVVEQQGVSTLSFSGGSFVLNKVEPGPGKVKIMFAKDPLCGVQEFTFAPDSDFNLQVIADKAGGTFIGRVVDGGLAKAPKKNAGAAAPSPIANALVTAMAGTLSDTTDSAGLFQLNHVPAGAQIILTIVLPTGDTMYIGGLTVTEGGMTDLDTIAVQNSVTQNGIKLVAYEARAFDNEPSVTLLAFATVVDSGKIAGYAWDLDGNGLFETSTPTGRVDLAVDSAGSREVSVRAVDTAGRTSGTLTVTVKISPFAVSDARLTSLALSAGKLTPAFSPTVYQYYDTLPATLKSLTFVPATLSAGATVTIQGDTVASGVFSAPYAIRPGDTTFTIRIVSQDSAAQSTYQVTLTRPASTVASLKSLTVSAGLLRPGFSPGILIYRDTLPYAVDSLTVNAQPSDSAATLTVTGGALSVGNDTITIEVTAEDGTTKLTYHLYTYRQPSAAATLSSLTISSGTLTPPFTPSVTSYAVTVINACTAVTMMPMVSLPGTVITLGADTVVSGTSSKAQGLSIGNNTITIRVTAQDGVTKTDYVLNVVRAQSNNALLSGLTVSQGTLSPVFQATTFAYDDTVGSNVTSMTVTPATADANATVTVNGVSASLPVSLPFGDDSIAVEVTAEDGVTKSAYTIFVHRNFNNDASLSALSIAGATLTPVFSDTVFSYAVSNFTADTAQVSLTLSDANASAKVNGITATGPVRLPLAYGANLLTVVTTAQDGATRETTTVDLFMDNRAPLISFTSPSKDTIVTDTFANVSGAVSDTSAVSVIWFGDMVADSPSVSLTGKNFSIPVFPLSPGAHTVVVRAVDAAGNAAQETLRVAYDAAAPQVTIENPSKDSLISSALLILKGKFLDDVGIAAATYSLQGAELKAPTPVTFFDTVTGNWQIHEGFLDGFTDVIVEAIDKTGKMTADTVVIRADHEKPAIDISYPFNPLNYPGVNFVTSATLMTLSGSASDLRSIELPASIRYRVTGAASDSGFGIIIQASNWAADSVMLAPGWNRVTVTATDSAGNDSAVYVDVLVKPDVVFVDAAATGTDDGSSWLNAFKSLSRALDSAKIWNRDTLWVANGNYVPDTTFAGANASTFALFTNCALLGGFQINDSLPSQRLFFDPLDSLSAPACTLSGDAQRDFNNYNNTFHVVTGADSALLEGFTVMAGEAMGNGPDRMGAGMINILVSPVVRHCLFLNNEADTGAGLYSEGTPGKHARLTLSQSRLYNNHASDNIGGGAGIAARDADVTVDSSSLEWGYCGGGGAFLGNGAAFKMTGGRMLSNYGNNGGAVLLNHSTGDISGVKIAGNQASYGGGAFYLGNSTADFSNNQFLNNTVYNSTGGAGYLDSTSTARLTACTFTANTSPYCTGGIHVTGGSTLRTIGSANVFRSDTGGTVGYCYEAGGAIYIGNTSALDTTAGAPDADSTNKPLPAVYFQP